MNILRSTSDAYKNLLWNYIHLFFFNIDNTLTTDIYLYKNHQPLMKKLYLPNFFFLVFQANV